MPSKRKIKPTYGSLMKAIKSYTAAVIEVRDSGHTDASERELAVLRYKLMKINLERVARAVTDAIPRN